MRFSFLIKYAICGLAAAFATGPSVASQLSVNESVDSLSGGVSVLYHMGSATIDPSLGNNARHLRDLTSWLDQVKGCDSLRITSLSISGSASPDGAIAFNASLARQRAESLEKYVRNYINLPDSIIHLSSKGIDWQTLADFVRTSDLDGREAVLDIISNRPEVVYDSEGKIIDSRRKRLMDLRGGRVWREMTARWFPYMRCASVSIAVDKSRKNLEGIGSETGSSLNAENHEGITDSLEESDSLEFRVESGESKMLRPFYMSAQTNMLYDVMLLPTLGAEFYLGKGWSIVGNWTYGWWSMNRKHRYWRAYGGYLAGRKWFGPAAKRKPLTGHHAGVYAQILTYDFEVGGKGQMAGTPGESLWYNPSYAFGVEYGYSLPIARRLNIDFTIGVGYFGGKYYKYRPVEGHYAWEGTSRRNYFGPTNAQISLVWLIGNGNVNSPKGGEK